MLPPKKMVLVAERWVTLRSTHLLLFLLAFVRLRARAGLRARKRIRSFETDRKLRRIQMGLFETSETFEEILGGFFRLIGDTPDVAEKLLASDMVIRFIYKDPDVVLVVDCSGEKIDVRPGDTDSKAEVEMSMTADIAHKFWFGKVNLMAALTRKQMVAKGPIPKILKLLPAIKPTYTMYPAYLENNGYGQYKIY